MRTAIWLAIPAALGILSAAPSIRAQENDDVAVRIYGEFEIGNGETKTLAYGKHDRVYRICLRSVRQAVPLRVMHDTLETLVYPGDCADVEGMHIQITPDARLGSGIVLLGRYNQVND